MLPPVVTPFLLRGKGACTPEPARQIGALLTEVCLVWAGRYEQPSEMSPLSGGCSHGQTLEVVRRGDHDGALSAKFVVLTLRTGAKLATGTQDTG